MNKASASKAPPEENRARSAAPRAEIDEYSDDEDEVNKYKT